MTDDDKWRCDACDWIGPIEQLCQHIDAAFCPTCDRRWREAYAACVHDWDPEPIHNDYGEPGRYCTRCMAFIADEDALIVFPLICDGWVPEAAHD